MTQQTLALAATSGGVTDIQVLWDLAAGAMIAIAVVRAVKIPAPRWTHRLWSKTAAIVVAVWGSLAAGGLLLPVGAVAVIWHTRSVARSPTDTPTVPDLPFAEGTPTSEGPGR